MKKVLIISSSGMGDCLWGTPGIRALKKTFPEVEIDLVVNINWRSLFEFNPYLSKIFDYREKWYSQPILGIQLLGKHYDAVFIFHANRNFKRMLPWLGSLPVWCHQNLDWVPDSRRVNFNSPIHGIQRRLIMLEKLGVKSDGGQMEIFFDPNTRDKTQEILKAGSFNSKKYVYLNLGAAVESRRWMVDRFAELARRILTTTSWSIILGGGPHEKERGLTILNQLNTPRVMEVCSQPILVNANIISKAGLMVTSDTGPMHIGFSMKTPIVALFGSIRPLDSGPYEIPENLCRIIKIDQKEKDNAEGPDPGKFHFRSITVNQVWEQVEKMLQENSKE
jgi:ADP-heptose:LPS heptosyltransferase